MSLRFFAIGVALTAISASRSVPATHSPARACPRRFGFM